MLKRAVAVLLLAGGCLAIFFWRRSSQHSPPPPPSLHGAGIDREMSAVRAMYSAPPGKTPCEDAFNAFKAADDLARTAHARAVVIHLAAREDFLARCNALPADAQSCLAPRYMARNREQCVHARPSAEVVKTMVELTLPGETTEPQETPTMPGLRK